MRGSRLSGFLARISKRFLYLVALLVVLVPLAQAQSRSSDDSARIQGRVCDSQNRPLAGVTVSLESSERHVSYVASTDSEGHYSFVAVPEGTYLLLANLPGYQEGSKGPFVLKQHEAVKVDLQLQREAQEPAKGAGQTIEFSDEPQFTVAGVTDPSNLGGHGSDVVLRTKEALAKDTVSLSRAAPGGSNAAAATANAEAGESADSHALLGEIAEKQGRPLDAVREYQRAAEMEPTEPHLFAWGAELLLHRALEPASEVFAKGHRLFPQSARMLVGLGVASYSRGSYDEAAQLLSEACDLTPADPQPYLFLGKIQDAEKVEPPGWTERLKRFAALQPDNALANYYYAVALTKQGDGSGDFAQAESLLERSIRLDPHLGNAYLQLGILYAQRKDFSKAIAAYQKAIENTPLPDEAHFRLAQAYRQTGELEKAREEVELYDRISKQKTEEAERDRHEIQQFVYTLRNKSTPSTSPMPNP